jgi:SAM-dependent methyltransferase
MQRIKSIIKKLILNPFIAKITIPILLRIHSFCYKWSGLMACQLNNGRHPKHEIMKYKEWFLSNIHSNWTILDIGSNDGKMPKLLSTKASLVYGIEISPQLVAKAKQENPEANIQYFCADATVFNYQRCQPIHCITLSNVLEHIENRVSFLLKSLIQNVNWADPQSKRLLIRVPMIDREWIVIYKKQLGLEYRLDPTHFIEYTEEIFKAELNEAGIEIQSSKICYGEIYAICQVYSMNL